MGLMRLGLALCVLIFHGGYGGAGGPVAVYGFYVLSGYLIYRVYLERYQQSERGLSAFYWNRFLRIIPLFVVSSLLAYVALLSVSQFSFFRQLPVNGLRYMTETGFSGGDWWSGLRPEVVAKGLPRPQVVAYFGWLPQFWTVSIELAFYLVAPSFCWMRHRWGPRATVGILAGTFLIHLLYASIPVRTDIGLYMDIVYRNAIPTLFFFALGMGLYDLERVVRWRLPARTAAATTVVVLGLILAGTKHLHTGLAAIPEMMLWQALAVAGVIPVIFSRPWELPWARRIDGLFADLSYGVYLNQSVLLVFFFAWRMGTGQMAGSAVAPFWQYLVLSIATIGLSWLTLVGVERQFNRGRAVLGRGPAALPTTTATPQRAL